MKPVYYALLAISVIMLPSCSENEEQDPTPIEIELTRSESNAITAINDFSFDVLKATDESIGVNHPNYVFSPQAYAWNIAMIANGATEGSLAEKELINALHLGETADINDVNNYSSKLIEAISNTGKQSRISVSNAVFYKGSLILKESYLNVLKSSYNVKEFVDPTNTILDNWIESQTDREINDFAKNNNLENLSFGVLSNLYFKGIWKYTFDRSETKEGDFMNADGSISKVPMMSAKMSARVGFFDFCNMLTLEFKGKMFGISFLIPTEGFTIDDVISKLNNEKWEEFKELDWHRNSLRIKIPKLDIRSDIDFKKISRKLGIKEIFDNPKSMLKAFDEDFYFTQNTQSTCLKMDEEGVVAAAVANMGGNPSSAGYEFFYLDEPFIYVITEISTGAILFMGKVSQL